MATIQERIIAALSPNEGSYSHQVVARTGLGAKQTSRVLSRMYFEKKIDRKREWTNDLSYKYFSKPQPGQKVEVVALKYFEKQFSILESRSDAAMFHKISMLRKLKGRLIDEHHSLIDAVIADYEWFIGTVARK